MTKREKIKEAWGVFYTDRFNEDGWLIINSKIHTDNNVFDMLTSDSGCLIRPKSLQGIEDNNGWIKIESEADLPKEKGNYLVIDKFHEANPSIAFYDPKAVIFLMSSWYERYSYYQLIENLQPPVY